MASRYWINNGGNWNDTTHWSATSGGAGSAGVPGAGDDVFFDANSFTLTGQTVTLNTAIDCSSWDWSAVTNNPHLTDTAAATPNPRIRNGGFILSSSMTISLSTITYFALGDFGTGVNFSINLAGQTLPAISVGFFGATTTVSLLSDITLTGTFSFPVGGPQGNAILTTNNYNITCRDISFIGPASGTTATYNFGTTTLTTTNGGITMNPSSITRTLNASSATFVINQTSATANTGLVDLTNGETGTIGTLKINSGTVGCSTTVDPVWGGIAITNLIVMPGATFKISPSKSLTVTNFTANGTSSSNIILKSQTDTSAGTITASTASVSYVNVRDNIAAGAGIPFVDIPGGTNTGNNTNWIFPISGTNLPSYNSSLISSVSRVQQNTPFPQFVIGGRNTSSYALFKKSTTYGSVYNIWRSQMFEVGKDFDVQSIHFNLVPDLDSNTEIIPVLYFDDSATSSVGTTINSTNYANTNKLITLRAPNFSNAVHGKYNFFLEFQFTGSSLAVIALPITINLDILDT